jgi:hypothetical protein
MPKMTSFEYHKRGFNSGWTLGFLWGKRDGRNEGFASALEGIALVLEVKFGKRGLRLTPQIEKLVPADLREFMRCLATAVSLREVRKHLANFDSKS